MKNNVRYLLNWGLAFDETRILKRFEELAEEGWFLESMTTFRYRLRKGAPSRLRYAMDYRRLQAEEEADYYAIFVPSLMMSVAYWIRMRMIRLEGDCHD